MDVVSSEARRPFHLEDSRGAQRYTGHFIEGSPSQPFGSEGSSELRSPFHRGPGLRWLWESLGKAARC